MISVREMNEEYLEIVAFGICIDAFVDVSDNVVIQNVVEHILDLLRSAGRAGVADEQR